MLPKVLTWSALAATILFAILALTAIFARESLGMDNALALANFGAVPLLTLSIAIAAAVLVVLDPPPPPGDEVDEEAAASRRRRALFNVICGSIAAVAGIALTVVAILASGPFRSAAVVTWGLIVFGCIQLFDGLAEMHLRRRA